MSAPADQEWEDDLPHTLIVEEFDDAESLTCHIDHLPTCKWVDEEWNGETVRYYQCAVAHNVDEGGLLESLEYGGTALPLGPGEHKIKAWGRLLLISPTTQPPSSESGMDQ